MVAIAAAWALIFRRAMPDVFTQAMRHDDRWQVLSPAERMRLVDKLPGEEIERTLPTLISAR